MYHLIDYVWSVEKFAQYFEHHDQEVYPLLTSPIFAYKNTRWVLNLYPEGLGDSASQGYISLFIKYVSEDPETINAKVELSLLNKKNERVYCRDTGDHQYQTFIDFGYKQFLKMQDIKDQKDDLIFNGVLKVFARVEFEHATLPSSLTWSNYDLLLFKENFKDLYETKNLCDIVIKVIRQPAMASTLLNSSNSPPTPANWSSNIQLRQNQQLVRLFNGTAQPSASSHHHQPYPKIKKQKSSSFELSSGSSFYDNDSSSSSSSSSSCSLYSGHLETLDIKSHKFILASRSGKFRELLKTSLININSNSDANNNNIKPSIEPETQNNETCSSSAASSSSTSSSSSCFELQNSLCIPSSTSELASSSCSDFNNSQIKPILAQYVNNECYSDISDLLIIETDRSPKVIEYLIRYMYTGYLDTLDSYAKDIYEISKEYKVHGLTNLAREHIIKELNIQNCCDYLVFCVINNDYELNNKVQTFISENYETIVKTNAYKQAKRKYRELFENTFNEILKKSHF